MTSGSNIKKRGRKADKSQALFHHLAEDLRKGVYSGRLPGVTILAQKYHACPATIQRTLQVLEEEGLVDIKPRSGTYVKTDTEVHMVVFMDKSFAGLNSPPASFIAEYESLYNGIMETLQEYGVALSFRTVCLDSPDALKTLSAERGKIIALFPQQIKSQVYQALPPGRWLRVMDAQDYNCPATHITYDNYSIGHLAANYLVHQGCRRFGYVGSYRLQLFHQRFESYLETLRLHGFDGEHLNVDIVGMTLSEVSRRMHVFLDERKELLRNGEFGLFCGADHFVVPLRQELASLGLAANVKLISCDNNSYYLKGVYPRSAEIDICMYEIGRQAVLEALNGKMEDCKKIAVSPRLLPPEQ